MGVFVHRHPYQPFLLCVLMCHVRYQLHPQMGFLTLSIFQPSQSMAMMCLKRHSDVRSRHLSIAMQTQNPIYCLTNLIESWDKHPLHQHPWPGAPLLRITPRRKNTCPKSYLRALHPWMPHSSLPALKHTIPHSKRISYVSRTRTDSLKQKAFLLQRRLGFTGRLNTILHWNTVFPFQSNVEARSLLDLYNAWVSQDFTKRMASIKLISLGIVSNMENKEDQTIRHQKNVLNGN